MKNISFKLLILTFLSILLYSCTQKKSDYTISGTLKNNSQKYIYLKLRDKVDSTFITENGTFTFTGNITEPEFFKIYFTEKDPVYLLLCPGDVLDLTLFDQTFSTNYAISGSEESAKIKEIMTHYYYTIDQIESLKKQYNDKMLYGNFETSSFQAFEDSINKCTNEIIDIEKKFLKEFIIKNKESFSAMSALYQTFDPKNSMPLLLQEPENISYFNMVDSVLCIKYPNSTNVRNFHNSIIQLKTRLAAENMNKAFSEQIRVKIGQTAPDFSISPDLKLSSFRGKYVLVDFWASWCIPCRKENKNLLLCYNKFAKDGFEVCQVSLDNSETAWKEAISTDSLIWKNHVLAEGKWSSEIVKNYGINAIPQNFLLDKEGKIIDINLHGKKLEMRLSKIFQK